MTTLFAGDPFQMSRIPMMAQRSVLASYECTLPHYLGYYRLMLGRYDDQLRLLYATRWEEALSLAQKRGVDYVIVPRALLEEKDRYSRLPSLPLEMLLRRVSNGSPAEPEEFTAIQSAVVDNAMIEHTRHLRAKK